MGRVVARCRLTIVSTTRALHARLVNRFALSPPVKQNVHATVASRFRQAGEIIVGCCQRRDGFRIIRARKATKHEQRDCEDNVTCLVGRD